MKILLGSPAIAEEIKAALWSISGDKSPGPALPTFSGNLGTSLVMTSQVMFSIFY